ncbi:hypothetical protein NC652_011286 [Populus alba x Populus x berolinensis]|uniref:Uncharacterized protein n=1 Tax=Populus alba x Populus x berolinensis TaxID=444605 RepID=A0AAD6R225_9ROSI|nr:hypothetical protein NC652_011286 [Populus alba x Populus x berolinensis]KAJ7000870.1 hypothetical protein NC653_011352 [Populus alba x Populus x berolinensis]
MLPCCCDLYFMSPKDKSDFSGAIIIALGKIQITYLLAVSYSLLAKFSFTTLDITLFLHGILLVRFVWRLACEFQAS